MRGEAMTAVAARGRWRVLLVSGLAFVALLFGVVGMHAAMVGAAHHDPGLEPAMSIAGTPMAPSVVSVQAVPMDGPHDMGGMTDAGCLMFGMLCAFGVAALVVLVGILLRGPLARLRPTALPRSGLEIAALGRLPRPPTLELLSISRT